MIPKNKYYYHNTIKNYHSSFPLYDERKENNTNVKVFMQCNFQPFVISLISAETSINCENDPNVI